MLGIGFIGGEGPSPERAAKLAGHADLIAAADSGLMAAEAAGLRPRWIVGDMDSLSDPSRLDGYPKGRVIRSPRDKDETDTELLLALLWDQGCTEVWLAGGGGGRLDHLLGVYSLFERAKSPDRWITAAEDTWRIRKGHTLEMNQGGLVSVFPLGNGPWEAESLGLKWPLEGLPWKRGFFGISNIAGEQGFTLRSVEGSFLVILPFGQGG